MPKRKRLGLWVGLLILTTGMAILGYLAWLSIGTDVVAEHRQPATVKQFRETLRPQPKVISKPPKEHGVYGIIRIPAIKVTAPIIQGVGVPDLRRGVGHYPGSSLIGESGNLAFAGHRTTWGHPFGNVDKLHKGDLIYVQSRTQTLIYKVVTTFVVKPNRIDVVSQRNLPAASILTLTTCNPKYSARERLVVRAVLT